MAKLVWDQVGEKTYETGVQKGVLYPMQAGGLYTVGVAWNGLTAVSESPSGAEASPIYADDIKYLSLMSAEEFGATIEAYTYPDAFGICDGSAEPKPGVTIGQQSRKTFGFCYRTTIGNDTQGTDYGYKTHLVYGALAAPSEKSYATINDSPEAITFSWGITTTPVAVTGFKPTASLVIDSTKVDPAKLAALELILFGNTGVNARLPLPDEITTIFADAAPLALVLSTSLPNADAVGVVGTSNIVLTFNNKIIEDTIVVTSSAGVVVPGTRTWDTTGKILTFDPTTSLTAAGVYLIVCTGVIDVYNQILTPVIRKFTVA
jgi:hypothetical protein